jgi:malate dehydrogenase
MVLANLLTILGEWTSMGVASDGSYGIPEGSISSRPVVVKNGKYIIRKDLIIGEFF